jgi:hypothetical protein
MPCSAIRVLIAMLSHKLIKKTFLNPLLFLLVKILPKCNQNKNNRVKFEAAQLYKFPTVPGLFFRQPMNTKKHHYSTVYQDNQ